MDGRDGGVDGGFGGSIEVEEAEARELEECGPEGGIERLATDEDEGEWRVGEAGGEQRAELGGGAVEDVDAELAEEGEESLGIGAEVVGDEAEGAAAQELEPLFDGGVEGEGGVEGDAQGGGLIGVDGVVESVEEIEGGAVLDHDALGEAGGAGGIDDVGEVVGVEWGGRGWRGSDGR